ncbi:MAG: serine hydrolase [Alphaproteobacteria bacterium]|nr:serine hydrolase [Alphaproteobacteria bacterium]
MRLLWLGLAALLPFVVVARAEDTERQAPKTLQELDARLAKAFESGKTPGAAIAVIEDNKVVWTKNYGVRDVAGKLPVTDDTVFRAGSVSKTFTSLLAMTYVAEGKLDLEAKLADVAPDIGFENPWEATSPLRIVHLLEHTTGWRDFSFVDVIKLSAKDSVDGGIASTRRLRVSRWQPGRYMAYSNVGPGVAGLILQRIGGAPFMSLMRDRVLRPMGMADADFEVTDANRGRLSKSYDQDGVSEIPYHGIDLAAAGSLLTTASDLAKLVIFMNTRGMTESGAQLVSADAITRMEHPHSTLAAQAGLELGYGLGVFYAPQPNFIVYGHNGGIDGFESAYVYWPDQHKGYVLLTNGGTGTDNALEAVTLYLGRDYKPVEPPEVKIDAKEFESYLGYYRPIAMRHPFMNALTGLYPTQITMGEDGRPNALSAPRIGLGHNMFRRTGRAEPTMIFYTTPEGDRDISTGREFFRELTVPELVWHGAILVGGGLAILLTALALLGRVVRVFVARWRRADGMGGVVVRWAPTLSVLGLVTMLAVFLFTANAGYQAVETLGRPDAATYTIYGASLAWPALAAVGFLSALLVPGVSRLSRASAFVVSLGMLILAVYFMMEGWVGIRFWD